MDRMGEFLSRKIDPGTHKKRWGYGWVACAFLAVSSGHLAWFWVIIGVGAQIVMVFRKKLIPGTLGYTFIFLLFSLPILAIIRLQIPNESITCRMLTEPSLDRLRLILRGCEDMVWYQATGPVFLLSEFPLRTILVFARKCWVLTAFLTIAGAVVLMTAKRIAMDTFSRKDPRALILFLVPALPIFVTALLDFERFHYRYFAFTEFASAVLVARALSELGSEWFRRVLAIGIAFMGAIGFIFMLAYPVDPFERDNYEGLARFVSQYGKKDDATVIFASYTGFHLKKMGLSTQAKMLEENEMAARDLRETHRIWVLQGIDPASEYFDDLRVPMEKAGYYPCGGVIPVSCKLRINLFLNRRFIAECREDLSLPKTVPVRKNPRMEWFSKTLDSILQYGP
jgi:hypothetical protein